MVGFQQRLCQQSLMQLEHFNLEDSATPTKNEGAGFVCVCVCWPQMDWVLSIWIATINP